MKKVKKDSVELAYEVFHALTQKEKVLLNSRNIDKILKSCKSKQEALLKTIELCGENSENPKELYIISSCYVLLGEKYRQQAIEYLKKYIAVIASYDNEESRYFQARAYRDLGKAYENSVDFDKAEQAYLTAEKLYPGISPKGTAYISDVIRVYGEKGDFNRALKHLESAKSSLIYKKDSAYKGIINLYISYVREKIKQQEDRKITIDTSSLDKIRSNSEIVCKMLLTEEEMEPAATKVIEENTLPQKTNTNILNSIEQKFLLVLLENGDIKKFAADNGVMPSLIADSINEKLFDKFVDTVIEFENDIPYIVEEYKEEISML